MKVNRSRLPVILGLVLMVLGAVDPLEGSVVILLGSALVALGAFLSQTHRYKLQLTALALITIGVGALFGLSAIGGVGGTTGRSYWWLLLCVPYPLGWVVGIIGAARKLREPRSATA
jgi:hypothetical protein